MAAPTPTLVASGWLVPIAGPPVRGGAVAWDGQGRIVAVGPLDGVRARVGALGLAVRERDLGDLIVLPGLVNAHTHLEYATYAGFGAGLGFVDWIAGHQTRNAAMTLADRTASSDLGAWRCLANGQTTVADLGFVGTGVGSVTRLGLRAIVCLEVFGTLPERAAELTDALFARIDDAAARAGPLVTVGASPHTPYTACAELHAAVVARARREGRPVHTHLAESRDEDRAVRDGAGPLAAFAERFRGGRPLPAFGVSPAAHLAAHDALDGVVCAHGVHLSGDDLALVAAAGARLVHCPTSNRQLGAGRADVEAWRAAGVTWGLGTDSPTSAGPYDLWEELRAGWQADRGDASPAAWLRAATLGGAEALGLDAQCGSLEAGKAADVIAVDVAGADHWPVQGDPALALLHGARGGSVSFVAVGGSVLVDGGHPASHIDAPAIEQAALAVRERLLTV